MSQRPLLSSPEFLRNSNGAATASPIRRVFATVLGVAMFAIAATIGAALFLVLLAVGAILAAVFAGRLWWWRRQLRKSLAEHAATTGPPPSRHPRGTVIDGEYRVVDREHG